MRTGTYLVLAGPLAALIFGAAACSKSSESSSPVGGGGTGGAEVLDFVTVVKGTLAADLPTSKATHDGIAGGSETQAEAAGDIAHIPMLGTTHLGTTANQFFDIDQWNNYDHMVAFYQDPQFQSAFGTLFSAAPVVESFVRSDFHSWGDIDAGGTGTRYFVFVRGKLKGPTLADARTAHDAVAGGGETQVKAAGDVAHLPYIGKDDPLEFCDFDIWGADTNIDAVYSDPNFASAFNAIFATPPTIGVYATSDWHSW